MPEAEKDAVPLPISQYWPTLGFSISKSISVFSQKKMKNQKATGLEAFSKKKNNRLGETFIPDRRVKVLMVVSE